MSKWIATGPLGPMGRISLMGLMAVCVTALAQPKLDEHAKKDIERHRLMAAAHEEAARCLESGKSETECVKTLQQRCKGIAIGKYCGMKHEH